jgi:flagellar motor switch protein FliM
VKPERPLSAAGIAASHSDALFRRPAEELDLLPEFERLGERLARLLGPALGAVGGGKAPEIRVAGVERSSGGELAGALDRLAANALLAPGTGKHRLLLSIDGAALLAQLDRAFGGTGEIAAKPPSALPLSADLLAQRIEQAIADHLTQLAGLPQPLAVVERDASYASLAPFREADALAVLSLEVRERDGKPLVLTLATRTDSLAALLPSTEVRRRAPERKSGPLDEPFGEIVLTLEAVLSEMRIPLSRIAALEPGQTLAIPVARAVPLRIGGTLVARGTVGELDDRVALQITRSDPSRKDFQ